MRGAKYSWGIKISRFSTSHSLYLANDTRQSHSYYGTLIGTRMRSLSYPEPRFQSHGVTVDAFATIDAFDVLCEQITRDLFAIAKFLVACSATLLLLCMCQQRS